MSKLACGCGSIISDVCYPSPSEGRLEAEQDQEGLCADFVAEADAFLEAVRSGRRDSWLAAHFGPEYPQDLTDGEILDDIRTSMSVDTSIAECLECGRLHVQIGPGINRYVSYRPDDPGCHRVLRGKRNASGPQQAT